MKMRAARHVPRSFKHHVFEKMRETRAPRKFVRRSHVVPQVHRHHWQPMIFGKDHLQPVVQLVLFEFQLRHHQRGGLRRRNLRGRLR